MGGEQPGSEKGRAGPSSDPQRPDRASERVGDSGTHDETGGGGTDVRPTRLGWIRRIRNSVVGRAQSALNHPALYPTTLLEAWHEGRSGHPAHPEHHPHTVAALDWLIRSQDATPDAGFARGYCLTWNPYFRTYGWQPSYPETTGYIIPTFYEAAARLDRPDFARRAELAARWELHIQLGSGAVRGGVIGQPESPAVFNTGQVILGWLAALEASNDAAFADATRRAAAFLVADLDPDGIWRQGNSKFAKSSWTLYNARTAWALAEAGVRLEEPGWTAAAVRALRGVMRQQAANGWFPNCCLLDCERPLLHTLAYTIRGLLEGGRLLHDDEMIAHAELAATALAERVRPDGWMAGRYASDWSGENSWSCLTGVAQMANVWLRLYELTRQARWLELVPTVLLFLKTTQNRTTRHAGLRGGIKGSSPMNGGYGRYEVLNWATKFFADALMRHDDVLGVNTHPVTSQFSLA